MSSSQCPKCQKEIGNAKDRFCPSCGARVKGVTAAEKKARLTDKSSGRKTGLFMAAAIVGVLALSAGAFIFVSRPQPAEVTASSGPPAGPTAEPETLKFQLADFQDGQAKYYRYRSPSGKDIRFFILKSNDGVVRAAFDTCDVCYRAKKGYRQEGDEMVCNNCGQRFASHLINEIRGGCNPAPLERNVQGEQLVVKVGDILSGSRYF